DLHRVGAPAVADALFDELLDLLQDVRISLAERCDRPGARAHVADLDHARLRVDRNDIEDRGRCERAKAGLDESAAVQATTHGGLPRLARRMITQVECITDQADASAPCPTMRYTRHCEAAVQPKS